MLSINAINMDRPEPPKWKRLYWKFKHGDWIPSKVKYTYWHIVPYDWRPRNIYWVIKNALWKHPNRLTIKTLSPYHWSDRTEILPHAIFQVLDDFVKGECSPGVVDWDASGHTVKVNGIDVNVRHEMDTLLKWWHEHYLKSYPQFQESIWDEICHLEKHIDIPHHDENGKIDYYEWGSEYINGGSKEHVDILVKLAMRFEVAVQEELQEKLKRVIALIPFLWT